MQNMKWHQKALKTETIQRSQFISSGAHFSIICWLWVALRFICFESNYGNLSRSIRSICTHFFSSSAWMQQQRLFMTLSLKYQLVATNRTKCALKSGFLIRVSRRDAGTESSSRGFGDFTLLNVAEWCRVLKIAVSLAFKGRRRWEQT